MKYSFLLTLILLLGLNTSAQVCTIDELKEIGLPFNEDTYRISYSGVVEVSNMTKEQLFSNVKNELAILLKDKRPIILVNDIGNLKYAVQSSYEIKRKKQFLIFINIHRFDVVYTLIIDFKDNRFRYTVTDFSLFDKEKPEYKTNNLDWGLGISTGTIKSTTSDLVPVEKVFKVEAARSDRKRWFSMFKQGNSNLINSLNQIAKHQRQSENNW